MLMLGPALTKNLMQAAVELKQKFMDSEQDVPPDQAAFYRAASNLVIFVATAFGNQAQILTADLEAFEKDVLEQGPIINKACKAGKSFSDAVEDAQVIVTLAWRDKIKIP